MSLLTSHLFSRFDNQPPLWFQILLNSKTDVSGCTSSGPVGEILLGPLHPRSLGGQSWLGSTPGPLVLTWPTVDSASTARQPGLLLMPSFLGCKVLLTAITAAATCLAWKAAAAPSGGSFENITGLFQPLPSGCVPHTPKIHNFRYLNKAICPAI